MLFTEVADLDAVQVSLGPGATNREVEHNLSLDPILAIGYISLHFLDSKDKLEGCVLRWIT
jgi:hypothetical protein